MSTSAEVWGQADYELIARQFAPIHDDLVARLAPEAGERWLDLATGTGDVALRAARAGAEVTGLDIAPVMLERARAKADAAGLEIRWDEGTAEELPYEDGSFDVVSSCFGIIFAPDHEAVARELGQVCRRGGRLGLANWRPNEGLHAIYAKFMPDEVQDSASGQWGDEAHVEGLLGEAFDLSFDERVWCLEGESPEAVWETMVSGAPPVKALVESLSEDQLASFRAAMLEHWSGFRGEDGVSEPRRYLVVTGTRR